MTGLFRHPSASSIGAGAHQRAKAARKLDAFAELLSNEVSPADAAERLGHAREYGRVLLQRLIRGLGREQCR